MFTGGKLNLVVRHYQVSAFPVVAVGSDIVKP